MFGLTWIAKEASQHWFRDESTSAGPHLAALLSLDEMRVQQPGDLHHPDLVPPSK
jgi:hypothetical protein